MFIKSEMLCSRGFIIMGLGTWESVFGVYKEARFNTANSAEARIFYSLIYEPSYSNFP